VLASITAQPEFTSIILEIVTDSKAFAALTSFVAQPVPTGLAGENELNNLINDLPSDAQVFFRSITAAEGSIVSSIVYAGEIVSTASTTIPAMSTSGGSATIAVTTSSPSQTGQSTAAQNIPGSISATSSQSSTETLPNTMSGPSVDTLSLSSPPSKTPQNIISGSTLSTITASTLSSTPLPIAPVGTLTASLPATANSSSSRSEPTQVVQSGGVLLKSGGLGLVLAILGASIVAQ